MSSIGADIGPYSSAITDPRGVSRSVAVRLGLGAIAGLTLGVVARFWMRIISDNPEFTWAGTLFIVGGFGVLGLSQAGAAAARTSQRPWRLTIGRSVGVVGMLPLFIAAGALMAPTVILGGLAAARTDWPRAVRIVCGILAIGPVIFVGNDLLDTFGWSVRAIVGFVGLLLVYAPFVWATRFTFAPRATTSPFPRWLAFTLVGLAALVLIVALIGGGIQ